MKIPNLVYLLLYLHLSQCSRHDRVLLGPEPDPPYIELRDPSDHPLVMAGSTNVYQAQHQDPQSQLSTADLAELLMKYTHDAIKEERDHTNDKIREERRHTSDIIKRVIQALSDAVISVNTSKGITESKIDEVNLKVDTVTSYYQELLFNLKSGLLETFQSVQADMNVVWSKLQVVQDPHHHCTLCGKESQSVEKLIEHVVTNHSPVTSLPSTQSEIFRPAIESHQNLVQASCYPEGYVQNCNFCDLSFPSQKALELHLREYHSNTPSSNLEGHQTSQARNLICYSCSQVFSDPSNLTEHFEKVHGKKTSLCCNLCGNYFESTTKLDEHMLEYHTNPEFSYNTCNYTSYSGQDQDTHIETEHGGLCIPQYDGNETLNSSALSPVPQYDGLDDSIGNEITRASIQSSSSSLQVPYQLNQEKQVKKLIRDAKIADFEMHSNDSDRNVSIQCSVGYYGAVVLPAISSLSTGFSQIVHGISIKCTSVRKAQDKNLSTPGLFLRFELSGPDTHPNPAPLSLHLHNTQRKVQLQGGAVMPDTSKVPVWFAQNVLRDLFNKQARSQNYQILEINRLVTNVASKQPPSCYHCKKRFSTNSRPVHCTGCSHSKHSTKCSVCPAAAQVPVTQCDVTGVTVTSNPVVPMPSTPATSLSSTTAVPMSSTPSAPIRSTHGTQALPATSSLRIPRDNQHNPVSVVTAPSPSMASSDIIVPQHPPPYPNTISNTASSMDSNTPPFLPIPGSSSSTGATLQANGAKAKTKNRTAKQKEGITIDYNKIELDTIRARLKVLETKNKDLEFQNKLLLDRIALFEQAEKEAIYEKYFPKPNSIPATEQHPSTSLPMCQGTHMCCMVRPACCHLHGSPGPGPHTRTAAEGSLDLVLKSISDLKGNIDDLKDRFKNIEALATTPHQCTDNNQDQSAALSTTEILDNSTADAKPSDNDKKPDDDSVVTVDMNVNEHSDEESLNSMSLTNRLLELRQ